MKEYLLWIILYCIYWYLSTIIGNVLYNVTKINWTNDAARICLPFIFLCITYMLLKFKDKNTKEDAVVKISENKTIMNSLKIIGIVLGTFIFVITLIIVHVIVSLK